MPKQKSPFARVMDIVRVEKKEITAIYFYAILNGLIQLSLPVGVQAIIGYVLGASMVTSIVLLIMLVILGVFVTGLMQINQMKIIEKIEQKVFVRYSFAYSEKIPRLDLDKTDSWYLPELVNRFFDAVTLQKGLSKLLLDVPAAMIQILFGLLLLSVYHPAFIFFGLILLLILWIILYFTGARGLSSSLEESSAKYEVAGWLEEMARSIRSFKFSQNARLHQKKTDEQLVSYIGARTRHFKVLLIQFRSLVGFKVIITAAMLIVGSILLVNQQLNIGQFIAAEIVILTIMNSVEKLIGNIDSVYDVLTAAEKLGQLTDAPIENEGSLVLPPAPGPLQLELKDVSFTYQSGRTVLKNVSMLVEPGQKVCIQGDSGSGKSTLLRLFTGAYSEFSGSVLINNIPIGNYQLQSLRANTGMLFSKQELFKGSLWENITMGRDGLTAADIGDKAARLGLDGFIAGLPLGFDSQLDPVGRRLPAIIAKKILLLRALVQNPPLLLLEEPWQGLSETDRKKVQQWLLGDFAQTTLLIVTNDRDFAARCDKTILLD
jgi:ATP-binding cassette, subfamily B, bacterial